MYLNETRLIGNLTRTPELKNVNGTDLVELSIAINEYYTDSAGVKVEKTDFIPVVVFGPQAINCSKYLTKGQQVMVVGKITNRAVEKDDGTKGYKTGVTARTVQFGSKPTPKEPNVDYDTQEVQDEPTTAKQAIPTQSSIPVEIGVDNPNSQFQYPIEYPGEDINPEDIPF